MFYFNGKTSIWVLLESFETDFLGLGEINRIDPSVTHTKADVDANNCSQRKPWFPHKCECRWRRLKFAYFD